MDKNFDKAKRAAKRERDRKIRHSLQNHGKKPKKKKLDINSYFDDQERRKAG